VVVSDGWARHSFANTKIIAKENGRYEVVNAAVVDVDVPTGVVFGKWKFKPSLGQLKDIKVEVNFTANEVAYKGIDLDKDDILIIMSYVKEDDTLLEVYRGYYSENYNETNDYVDWPVVELANIDFGTEPQLVPSAF
jgi:hypothetical protein